MTFERDEQDSYLVRNVKLKKLMFSISRRKLR